MRPLLEILRASEQWLAARGIASPRLDAELLLGHVLGVERLQLYLMYDRPLSDAELDTLRALVRKRGERQPLAYLTGHKGFHAIDLHVRPGVLVPRPDTETLVDALLARLDADGTAPIYIADVGCGSGAVGLAIATADPRVRVYATDISAEALETTRENVAALNLADRVAVLRGPLLSPIPSDRVIDWVVSNPPYIPTAEIDTLEPEVAVHEPRLALDGGEDGLTVIRALIAAAAQRARRGLLMEIAWNQAREVSEALTQAGFIDIQVFRDLAGHERVVGGSLPPRA